MRGEKFRNAGLNQKKKLK